MYAETQLKDVSAENSEILLLSLSSSIAASNITNLKGASLSGNKLTNPKAWYYDAVYWAAQKSITIGSSGKFQSASACTSEQAITFLWSMAGKQAPKSSVSKFTDVTNKKSYFQKAILWENEKGIAKGSNGKFSLTKKCKSRDIVTFIYRYRN